MWIYVVITLLLALYYWWCKFARVPGPNYPPGPVPAPLLGYLPVLTAKNILVGLDAVHEKYGDVISINLGPSPRVIVIGDYGTLKEVFKDDKASARPPEMLWFNTYFRFGNGDDSRGLLFSHVRHCHLQLSSWL